MLPGASSKRSLEPARGWSDLRETSRTLMKLCLDLNWARVFTRLIGIPSSWVFVVMSDLWDLSVNGLRVLGLDEKGMTGI